jgi:hypothetical protein
LASQNIGMQMASGKVVDGRVELDGELPEGASVTVIAREGDETFEADPTAEKMLLEAIPRFLADCYNLILAHALSFEAFFHRFLGSSNTTPSGSKALGS